LAGQPRISRNFGASALSSLVMVNAALRRGRRAAAGNLFSELIAPIGGKDQLLPRFLRINQRDLNFSPAQPALSNASVGPRSQTLFLITER
jgi:hypothetical protein